MSEYHVVRKVCDNLSQKAIYTVISPNPTYSMHVYISNYIIHKY